MKIECLHNLVSSFMTQLETNDCFVLVDTLNYGNSLFTIDQNTYKVTKPRFYTKI